MNKTIITVAMLTPLLMLCACMKTYGRFHIDPEVAREFQTGVVRQDLRYYYAGRENLPYAIIGVDRTYSVPSKLWTDIDPDSDQLRKMSKRIYWDVYFDPFGANLLAPDGRSIGIWYSTVYNFSVHVDQGQRTVEILFVNPENQYEPGW